MKSTRQLSVNMTRNIILILGIIVALLLTLNSGLIGDAPSLTSGFQRLLADAHVEGAQHSDRLEQAENLIQAGRNVYSFVIEFLNTN